MYYLRNAILALTVISLCSTGCMLKKSERKVDSEEEKFSERDQMQKAMKSEEEKAMSVGLEKRIMPQSKW